MCIGCCSAWSTASSVLSTARPSATKTPSLPGGASAGLPSKKSGRRGPHDRLGRSIGLLSLADGGPYLGATAPHPDLAGPAHPRPSGGDRRPHPRRTAVSQDPAAELSLV